MRLGAAVAVLVLAASAALATAAESAAPANAPSDALRMSPLPAHGSIPSTVIALLTKRVAVMQRDASEPALFAPHSWYVPPPSPSSEATSPTIAIPQAPPVPYSYLGSYARDGDTPMYFLVRSNRIYTVQPGDELEGTYRIDAVRDGRMLLTFKPLNVQQTILVGGDRP